MVLSTKGRKQAISNFAVRVERIVSIESHPNADRLELAQILDWRCVVGKGEFKPGDLCVYFPIDSVLPENVESAIFGENSKIKLDKHRVRTIKLRGAISQGLVTKVDLWRKGQANAPKEGDDLTTYLQVKKYEPPTRSIPGQMQGSAAPKKYVNPNFKKYTDLENAKNYPNVFQPDDMVVVTEKIHGTNFRAGWVPFDANTFWRRVKKFFGLAPEWEFVYGSRNVQLQDRGTKHKTWYQQQDLSAPNVYAEIVDMYRLREHINKGDVLYGEIYGEGIQKGYSYGLPARDQRHDLVAFDVMRNGNYLDWDDFNLAVNGMVVLRVPVIYYGPFQSADAMKRFTVGASKLDPATKVREGVVVKPMREQTHPMLGRKILKFISEEFLLKDQSDFH